MHDEPKWYTVTHEFIEGPFLGLMAFAVAVVAVVRLEWMA